MRTEKTSIIVLRTWAKLTKNDKLNIFLKKLTGGSLERDQFLDIKNKVKVSHLLTVPELYTVEVAFLTFFEQMHEI